LKEDTWVTIKVFNLLGQEIATLRDEQSRAGYHSVVWEGRNDRGETVGSGMYLYLLKTSEVLETGAMTILK
jgi:flagellar hook assembly protein FlgD